MRSNLETALTTIITAAWANRTDGDVEAPSGHVSIVDCTTERDMLASILEEDLDYDGAPTIDDVPDKWFVVREDSHGLVFVSEYDTEREATVEFDALVAIYDEWASQPPEGYVTLTAEQESRWHAGYGDYEDVIEDEHGVHVRVRD